MKYCHHIQMHRKYTSRNKRHSQVEIRGIYGVSYTLAGTKRVSKYNTRPEHIFNLIDIPTISEQVQIQPITNSSIDCYFIVVFVDV